MKTFCIYFIAFAVILPSCNMAPTVNYVSSPTVNYQADVLTRFAMDSIFESMEWRNYSKLNRNYHMYSDPDLQFKPYLKTRQYCIVTKDDLQTKIAGKFRIADFVAHDEYYRNVASEDTVCELYWLIDKKVMYMMLELIQETDRLGHDMYAFDVVNGHRHPRINKEVRGAGKSQHIFGRAIDIRVKDVNQDGRVSQKDKKILYMLLEEIVGDKGGIGRYPGTMSLHFDCRGYKARWDIY